VASATRAFRASATSSTPRHNDGLSGMRNGSQPSETAAAVAVLAATLLWLLLPAAGAEVLLLLWGAGRRCSHSQAPTHRPVKNSRA
jgi:hypothetical protein